MSQISNEAVYISLFMSNPELVDTAKIMGINSLHFEHPGSRQAFELLSDLKDTNQPIDIATCIAKRPGLSSYLLSCESHMTTQNPEFLLNELIQSKTVRESCLSLSALLLKESLTASELRKSLKKILERLETTGSASDCHKIASENVLDTLRIDSNVNLVPLGIPTLDNVLGGGFELGGLCMLGGKTGMGKTALAINISLNIAMRNIPTVYYSVEVNHRAFLRRLLARICKIEQGRLKSMTLNPWDEEKLSKSGEVLRDVPLFVNDSLKPTLENLLASMSRQVRDGSKVFFIDYLQKFKIASPGRNQSKTDMLGEMSGELKRFAVKHNVAIFCLVQLNREGDEGSPPTLKSIRDSDEMSFDADLVLAIHREAYYEKKPGAGNSYISKYSKPQAGKHPDEPDRSYICILKNRDGANNEKILVKDALEFAYIGEESFEPIVSTESEPIKERAR